MSLRAVVQDYHCLADGVVPSLREEGCPDPVVDTAGCETSKFINKWVTLREERWPDLHPNTGQGICSIEEAYTSGIDTTRGRNPLDIELVVVQCPRKGKYDLQA